MIIIGYGTNESFEGEAGLPAFKKGLETLLDALAPAKARIVLLSPCMQENMGPPMRKPIEQNRLLMHYSNAIGEIAKKRGAVFINLYDRQVEQSKRAAPLLLTDNGIHLTDVGYYLTAQFLMEFFERPVSSWIEIDVNSKKLILSRGTTVDKLKCSCHVNFI